MFLVSVLIYYENTLGYQLFSTLCLLINFTAIATCLQFISGPLNLTKRLCILGNQILESAAIIAYIFISTSHPYLHGPNVLLRLFGFSVPNKYVFTWRLPFSVHIATIVLFHKSRWARALLPFPTPCQASLWHRVS